MRIVLLSRTFLVSTSGGMERHATWMSEALRRAGHEVIVIAAAPSDASGGSERPNVVTVDAPVERWSAQWAHATAEQVEAIGPEVVAAESTAANHLAGRWPVVTHLHGNHLNELSGAWMTWGRRRTRTAVRRSAELSADYIRWKPWRIAGGHVIALTAREARIANVFYRVPRGGLSVIGNPVSGVFGVDDVAKQRIITFAGRLDPSKGAAQALHAFAASSARRNGYVLHFAGDGPEREKLEALVNHLDVTGTVRFHGRLEPDRLAHLLAESQIACFPSIRRESFSIGVLEAMASRCAVIASPSAGVDDITNHPMVQLSSRSAASLVKPTTTDAWADAIDGLVARPTERAALAEAGFELAQSFTETKVLDRIVLAYETARGRHGAGVPSVGLVA